ncbi:MAG TPA: CHRD domain-containing protein [Caulobacteraceae bacterium]|nr:CHRD domain-containing protein [Caulobacteraceae bacterium]
MTSTLHRALGRSGLALAALAFASLPGLASAAAATEHGGRPLTASLTGTVEVPPGDPDGTGEFKITVNHGQGQVCYTLSVAHIDPATAAHVHKAPVGVAGPVVIPLTAPTTGSSSGCANVAKDLALDLIQNPQAYYVNVHNAAYPAGAVRGQLSK